MNALRDMMCIDVMQILGAMRLSTLLEYSNGGYVDECSTRYDLHICNVDLTHNDSQNDRTHSQ